MAALRDRRTGRPVTMTADGRLHTLVIGAGPSGLAAAWRLAEGGIVPLVLERLEVPGGLMRSIRRGDFIVDIGRKEIYARLPEVDETWHELLGSDLRPYPHRVGSLYRGRILELSASYRGIRRGMPLRWVIAGGMDLGWRVLSSRWSRPRSYQDYWYQRAGRRFARLLAQGYWEKFRGQAWAHMPVPAAEADGGPSRSHSMGVIRQAVVLSKQGGPLPETQWYHPARGSGQIAEVTLERLAAHGVGVAFRTEVVAMTTANGHIETVTTRDREGERSYRPQHVVSSLQIEDLASRLEPRLTSADRASAIPESARQGVVLVYLFLDESPRFPHAWLEVNDTSLRSGRITNYAAFGGEMVPEGQTALCVEFFCRPDDPIGRLSATDALELAVDECVENGLIDPDRLIDSMVMTMPRTNAAASWRDWQQAERMALLESIRPIDNLFHVNRPGMDWATYAGTLAARAILDGDRREFDDRADPTKRHIHSGAVR